MNFKKLSILTLVLVALGLYFFLYEDKKNAEKKEVEENAKKIIIFKPDNVEKLIFKKDGKKIVFSKEQNRWMIKEYIVAKGDNTAITNILHVLQKAEIERVVNEKPDDLSAYGLKEAPLEITVKEKGQPPMESILLGAKNPTKYYIYLKKGNSQTVMITHSGLKDEFNKDINFFREKKLFNIKIEDIKQLFIKYEGKIADLRLDDKQDWQIIEPIKAKADGVTIRRMLYNLINSKVEEFVEEQPKNLSRFGLQNTRMEITFFTEVDKPLKTLLIGKGDKIRKGYYAKWKQKKNVFLIPQDSVRFYPNTEFDLRDKSVIEFNKDKILRVELHYPKEKIIIKNTGKNQWDITDPQRIKADEFVISDLLWAVLDLEATSIVTDKPKGLNIYNLNNPIIKINLLEEGSDKSISLLVSRVPKEKRFLYAKSSTRNTVYKISSAILKDIIKTPFEIRDKAILEFKNEDIGRVLLNYPDKTISINLTKEDWVAEKPEKVKLYKTAVVSLLWDLKLLKFKEILSDSSKKLPANTVFEKPKVHITLWDKKNVKIDSIVIGEGLSGNKLLYAKLESKQIVYTIDSEFLGKLPDKISDLK